MEQGCVLPAKAKARTGTATATSYALHATAICIAKNVAAEKATTPQNTGNQSVNSTILPLSPRIKHLWAMGEHYFLTGRGIKFKCKLNHTKGKVLLVCFKCVDILLFASKHAKGMSLRYDTPFLRFLDNLISENWFFAEGERFLSFWRCHRPRLGGRRW